MRTDASVTQLGLDTHRKFSKVTARDKGDILLFAR